MRFALLAVLLLLPLTSGAQDGTALTSKGSLLIGGSASLTFADDVTSYGVSPRVGLFVADGLAVGARVSISRTTFDSGFGQSASTLLGADPFVTYYLASPEAALQPYISAAAGVSYVRRTNTNNTSSPVATSTLYTGEAAVGALLRLGPNVGLTGEAYYQNLFIDGGFSQGGLRAGIAIFLAR